MRPFKHCHYFICESKFYARTHVKITRQWKSTLISFNKGSLLKRCCYSSTPPIARTDSIRIDFLYRVIFTCVPWQIFTLVERGSTFSFTRDLLYIASILYTRVLSDSGNPPVIHFCAFWVSYLRLVSLPESLFSLQLILFTARPIYVTLPLSAVTPRRSWNLKLYDLQQEIVHKSAP